MSLGATLIRVTYDSLVDVQLAEHPRETLSRSFLLMLTTPKPLIPLSNTKHLPDQRKAEKRESASSSCSLRAFLQTVSGCESVCLL